MQIIEKNLKNYQGGLKAGLGIIPDSPHPAHIKAHNIFDKLDDYDGKYIHQLKGWEASDRLYELSVSNL